MRLIPFAIPPLLLAATAAVAATVGQPAPALVARDIAGKPVDLAALKGKTVVLEWNNPGCPFVQKHYGSGNMQKTQAAAAKAGVVWLTVNSSAPGKQGAMTPAEAAAFVKGEKATPAAYILDPKGTIGHSFDAKTTPGMYVIDAKGTLVYEGAIDDKPTSDKADIAGAKNLVLAALADVKAGRPVATPRTRSYGCSVKYAS